MIDDVEATGTGPQTVNVSRPLLIVLESPIATDLGRIIPVDTTVSIGRSADADVVIKDPALSRRHVEIVRTGSSCSVRDLRSRNGTMVNGAQIASIPLCPGDQIQIGATLLQFQDGSASNSDISVRRALADSGVALWEYLAETRELVFSEHIDPALDLPPSTLGRKRLAIRRCVHPDDRDRLDRALVVACGGTPLEIELRLQATPSLERWVVMRGQLTTTHGVVAGTLVDVTTLKRRETTLSRTALVFESFLDGVALTDQAGTIVDLNSAMATTFGLTRDHAIGRTLFSVVPVAEPARQFRAASTAMIETGRWTTTLQIGQESHFEILAFPLRTDRGEEAGAAWVFRDVTEKQRMSAQIAFLDRLASLGTLSAGVAHEINNPLTFILGNAEVIREELSPSEHGPLVEAVDEIVEGAHRIATIVRDLKVFSRADAGATPQALDVREAIEHAIKMTNAVVRSRARLVTAIEPTRLAHAVESRLVQVLVNLLMNAAQSIADDQVGATITIRAQDERDGIAIEIIDTGKGMPPEVVARAFEPFFTTKPMAGTGLGLSICHGLVTGMGGTIALLSSEGTGTTARIWLRAAATDQPKPSIYAAEPEPQSRLRVLVIDDEPMLLRSTTRILSDHEIVTADSYAAATERLLQRRESYDVILCDLMMPDGTGMDLHARLVAERPELVPHVIFITGGAFTERAQDFLRDTTNRHLAKPIDRQTLRRAVFAVRGQ